VTFWRQDLDFENKVIASCVENRKKYFPVFL